MNSREPGSETTRCFWFCRLAQRIRHRNIVLRVAVTPQTTEKLLVSSLCTQKMDSLLGNQLHTLPRSTVAQPLKQRAICQTRQLLKRKRVNGLPVCSATIAPSPSKPGDRAVAVVALAFLANTSLCR